MKQPKILKRCISAVCSIVIIGASISPVFAFGVGDPSGLPEQGNYPYYDTSLSFEERAADLVSRMTLDEKITQLEGRDIPGIPRLGVASTRWYREALHGVARLGAATSFPTSLGMAATWDSVLINEMSSIISDEARTIPNDISGEGLNFWSPTINLARDPRWGRSEESYGEDPFLTTQIATGFVNGLQGAGKVEGDKYLKAMSTLKHLVANNKEDDRETSSSNTDERTLREYYAKTFKDVIGQAAVQSVMTTYNAYNGVPTSLDTNLIDTLLRRTWGFRGHVVTDCGALASAVKQGYKPVGWEGEYSYKEVTADALKNGIDLNCGDVYRKYTKAALEAGLITMDEIDNALVRTFTARMKTGEFDPTGRTPWDNYSRRVDKSSSNWQLCDEKHTAEECTHDHTKFAEDMADDSVILLKNDRASDDDKENILPLDPMKNNSIVVVGSLANKVILGDYSGSPTHTSTPLQGITKYLQKINPEAKVTYIEGSASSERIDWLRNMKEFTFYRTDGTKDTYTAAQADEVYNCKIENDGANIGSAKPPMAWVKYKGINVNQLKEVGVSLSSGNNCANTIVEVRRDSPDGALLASFSASASGQWGKFIEDKAPCTNFGDYNEQDVYIVFKEEKGISFSADEKQKIKNADTVIAYVGTTTNDAGEGRDRKNLELPRNETVLIKQLVEMNPRTVVYMQAVGQMDIEPFKKDVPAILWCTYNGQAQGNAVGRLLFGEANPSAKLPFTWYTNIDQLGDMDDYAIRSSDKSNGRTYQYFKGDVTYPFGYGLSYSSFEYSNLTISANTVTPNDTLTVEFDVKNTSTRDGKEVAQVYIVSPNADKVNRPARRLKGFDKKEIAAGQTVHYTIDLPVSDFYYWDEVQEKQVFDQGQYLVQVGPDCATMPLQKKFELNGELNVQIKSVTAIPSGRVFYESDRQDRVITTKLSAVHNDETFTDLEGENVTVTYTSNKPMVAQVDQNGNVTAGTVGGTATITATVTENGITKSDSFAVRVEEGTRKSGMVLSGAEQVKGGESFNMQIGVAGLKDKIYAEDITLSYDPEIFSLETITVEGKNEVAGIKRDDINGTVTILTGSPDGVIGAVDLLNVTFRAKDTESDKAGTITVVGKLGAVDNHDSSVVEVDEAIHQVKVKAGTTEEPNKDALVEAIQNAEELYAHTEEGTKPGQYPEGAKAKLMAAIERAKNVMNNATTQGEVDQAVTDLTKALQEFIESKIPEIIISGDVNKDGKVDVADLALIAYYYQVDLGNNEIARVADVNKDDKVDIIDLTLVANKILGNK